MTARAQQALKYRRIAIGAERAMVRADLKDDAFSIHNIRVWQKVFADALRIRSMVLRAYLEVRKER